MNSLRTIATRIVLSTLLLGSGFIQAQESAAEQPADQALWGRARDSALGLWNESQAFANRAMGDARRLFEDEQDFGRVWEQTVPKLEQALRLEERQEALPERAWIGADQESAQAEIDALLDEAVEVLKISPVGNYRDQIAALREEIERTRAEIAGYRRKQVSAPRESTLTKTVADYDRLISKRQAEITEREAQIRALEQEFAQALRGIGLELSDDQVDLLLSTVVGDNMVDLGILFDNVKAITLQLEQLVGASGEDLATARRYYGLYVVLLKALSRMHIQIEAAIAERYRPQIDAIITEAQQLSGETRRLMHLSPDKLTLLRGNLEAQTLTVNAAGIYRDYLDQQLREVRAARKLLDRDIEAAWNTYETVRVSGELVGLVKSSQALLEGLKDRQMPTLRPFESLEMQREMRKLTEQLRGGAKT